MSADETERSERSEFERNSEEHFMYCMDNEEPFFGHELRAQQGTIGRHAYMDKLVAQECLNSNGNYDILEIGSYVGMSAVTWAKAIQKYNEGNGKVFCIDPWKPYLESGGDTEQIMNRALGDGQAFRLFLHNMVTSNCKENVVAIKSESDKALPLFSQQKFDLIYIDGDHRYEQFKKDLVNSMPLVKDRGIISGDDLEMVQTGKEEKPVSNLDHVWAILSDGSKMAYHPGVTRGIWEAFGLVSCWDGFWAMRRSDNGWGTVTLTDIENVEMPKHLEGWQDIYRV